MKKLIRIMLALALVLSMSLCLFSCDELLGDTPDSKDSADSISDTIDTLPDDTEPEETEPEKTELDLLLEGGWQQAAQEAIKANGVTATSKVNVVGYYEEQVLTENNTNATTSVSGDNQYVRMEQTTKSVADTSTGYETVSVISEVTALKEDGGYKMFVHAASGANVLNALVNVTDQENEEATEMLFGSSDENEIAMSILDFNDVKATRNADGSYTLVCTNIKQGFADVYTNMFGLMFGDEMPSTVKEDSFKYTAVVKDNKLVSAAMEFELDVEIMENFTVTYKTAAEYEYDYSSKEITAPADWNYATDVEYSWQEYLDAMTK